MKDLIAIVLAFVLSAPALARGPSPRQARDDLHLLKYQSHPHHATHLRRMTHGAVI